MRLSRALSLIVLFGVLAGFAGLTATHADALGWSGPLARDVAGTGPALDVTACPTSIRCVALDTSGGVVSFDPRAPAPSSAVSVLASTPTGLACPTAGRCVTVGTGGDEATFDPADPAARVITRLDPGRTLAGVSCLSSTLCVAVDTSGYEMSFDPGAAGSASRSQLETGIITAVSCAGTNSGGTPICMAVDNTGRQTTFSASNGGLFSQSSVDSSALTALTCPSVNQCLAFDAGGSEILLDPGQPGNITTTTLDAGQAIIGVTCGVAATGCVAVDGGGAELSFAPGGHGTRTVLAAAGSLQAVACASANLCTAVDGAGRALPFDASNAVAPTPRLVDGANAYTSLSCPLPSQCTAADGNGGMVTFDPQSAATKGAGTVDASGNAVYGVACPAADQCTAVDGSGNEVTFEPNALVSRTPVPLVKAHALLAIACPSVSQCTAVDDDQYAVSFDPSSPSSAVYINLGTPPGDSLTGLACPAVSLCVAVDGSGDAVTFDPRRVSTPKPSAVDTTGEVALACPAVSVCVAADIAGRAVRFAPGVPGMGTSLPLGGQPTALACPVSSFCVATDTAGRAVEFDPAGAGPTVAPPVGAAGPLRAVTCVSAGECVAADATGQAYLATGVIPAVPTGIAAPTITGTFAVGHVLASSSGRWNGAPTSFIYTWERCAANGSGCAPIAETVGPRLSVGPADAGHTIRVAVVAADAGGIASAVVSAPTPVIAAAGVSPKPGRVTVSHARLTAAKHGHLGLAFVLKASRGITTVTCVLPSGVTVVRGAAAALRGLLARDIGVRSGARVIAHTIRRRGRTTLVITVRRAVRSLRITVASPLLVQSRALQRRFAHRRRFTLSMHLRLAMAPGTWRGVVRFGAL